MSKKANWIPLKRYIDERDLSAFMYMGRALYKGSVEIYLYKNKLTRSYLNIDAAGKMYKYTPEGYQLLNTV